jgi:hypothetical protein
MGQSPPKDRGLRIEEHAQSGTGWFSDTTQTRLNVWFRVPAPRWLANAPFAVFLLAKNSIALPHKGN